MIILLALPAGLPDPPSFALGLELAAIPVILGWAGFIGFRVFARLGGVGD